MFRVQAVGCDQRRAEGVAAVLGSRDLTRLAEEVRCGGGGISFVLDGQPVQLQAGLHFHMPVTNHTSRS